MKTLYTRQIGQGPDLVLLHGWGAHSGVWESIVPALSTQFRLTLIDLPGFGQSPLVQGRYDIETVRDQVLAVAPPQATWVGWSLGGLIATSAALRAPERVSKLITVASTPCFVAQLEWLGMAPQLLHKFADQLRVDYQGTIRRFIALEFHGLDVNQVAIDELAETFLTPTPPLAALLGGLQILESVDFRDQLANIRCPMIGFFGRLDAMVPVHVAEQISTYQPNFHTVVFDQAAHIPFLTHQVEFLSQLRAV